MQVTLKENFQVYNKTTLYKLTFSPEKVLFNLAQADAVLVYPHLALNWPVVEEGREVGDCHMAKTHMIPEYNRFPHHRATQLTEQDHGGLHHDLLPPDMSQVGEDPAQLLAVVARRTTRRLGRRLPRSSRNGKLELWGSNACVSLND